MPAPQMAVSSRRRRPHHRTGVPLTGGHGPAV